MRGEGVYLYTEDGRRLLDGISSWWVNIHGHSHPRLNAALAAQARQLEHVMFAGCTHPPAVDLAERLVARAAARADARVLLGQRLDGRRSRAEAGAASTWGNRGEPARRSFIALHHAYHGDTVGAMSASEESVFTRPFALDAVHGASRARAVLLSMPARARARDVRDRVSRRSRAAARRARRHGRRRARRADAAGRRRHDRLARRVPRRASGGCATGTAC